MSGLINDNRALKMIGYDAGFKRQKHRWHSNFFNSGQHVCLMFSDLVDEDEGEVVQSKQFLIVQDGNGILLDPGA